MGKLLWRLFRVLDCKWCTGEERNVADFSTPNDTRTLQVQIYEGQIQVGLNGNIVTGLDIKYCPMCEKKLPKKEAK